MRHDAASSYLHTLDYSANEWSQNITVTTETCGSSKTMIFSKVETQVLNLNKDITDDNWCSSFSSKDTVCIESSVEVNK